MRPALVLKVGVDDLSSVLNPKRKNKYGAKRVTVDGYHFDSLKESKRYGELKLLERAGEISKLTVHPRYELTAGNTRIGAVEFDFRFLNRRHTWVIEDCKGGEATNTPLSIWKRRHFTAQYNLGVTLT